MLNIDQVKLLESKVEQAVELIKQLNSEKDSLKNELEVKVKRISELEKLIAAFKDDQSKIEEGIINALNQLSAFADASYVKKNTSCGHVSTETKTVQTVVVHKETETAVAEQKLSEVDSNADASSCDAQNNSGTSENALPSENETDSSDNNKQMDIF